MNFEQKYYEQSDVWNGYFKDKTHTERAQITLDLIPKGVDSILDIGCGVGNLTNRIEKNFVVGLDFAHTPLTYVKKNPIQANITNLPFKRKTFKLIIITEILEHLNNLNFQRGFNEIIRLDPDYILLSTPFNEDITLELCKCKKCGNVFNLSLHQRSFDTESLQMLFKNYDLEKKLYITYKISPNKNLIKIKQNFGIFNYSKSCMCNKCGNSVIEPKKVPDLFFNSFLTPILNVSKSFAGTKQPYHQILLFHKKL